MTIFAERRYVTRVLPMAADREKRYLFAPLVAHSTGQDVRMFVLPQGAKAAVRLIEAPAQEIDAPRWVQLRDGHWQELFEDVTLTRRFQFRYVPRHSTTVHTWLCRLDLRAEIAKAAIRDRWISLFNRHLEELRQALDIRDREFGEIARRQRTIVGPASLPSFKYN